MRVTAAHAKETKVWVATTSEPLKEIFDSRVEGPIHISKTFIVNLDKFLKIILDDLLEMVGGSTRAIPRAGLGSS
jgi:hypothetical protein